MSTKPMNKNRFVPRFETLENREMMSVTSVTLDAAGQLKVICDAANNNVSISVQSATVSLSQKAPAGSSSLGAVTGLSMSNASGQLTGSTGGTTYLFDSIVVKDLTKTTNNVWAVKQASVKTIEIDAGDGNNTLQSVINVDTTVRVGNGTNSIRTAAGSDNIIAGNGNNLIYSNDGGDSIIVGTGKNTVDAGNGDDVITARGGSGQLFGGIGTGIDVIADNGTTGPGYLIYGQDGNDRITSYNRNDVIDAGNGSDTANVLAGTTLRNCESAFISVPQVTFPNENGVGSAYASASRLLQAYGFSVQHLVIQQDNSTYGATPSELANRLAGIKKDTVLTYSANLASVLATGKPVLISFGGSFKGWVVVNGYNATTDTYQVLQGGTQISLSKLQLASLNNASGAHFSGAMIY